jgi:hypothetical protein
MKITVKEGKPAPLKKAHRSKKAPKAPTPIQSRWRVEEILLKEESEGPDYYIDYEFRVIDTLTGKTVKTFSGSSENGICYSFTRGVKYVILSEDNTALLVGDEDGKESRIELPLT